MARLLSLGRLSGAGVVLAVAVLLVAAGRAAPPPGGLSGGDRVVFQNNVTIETPVPGDAYVAGRSVRLPAEIGRHLHVLAGKAVIDGDIGGSVNLAGHTVRLNAAVAEALWTAGMDVAVAETASVGDNLRAFGREVRVAGEVGGDAHISAAHIHLAGRIAGDAKLRADRITVAEGARIDGDLAYLAPDPVPALGTRVAGDVQYDAEAAAQRFPETRPAENPWAGGAMTLARLAVALIAGGLVMLALPGVSRAAQRASAHAPIATLGAGALLAVICLLTAVLLAAILIGIPVVLAVVLAAPLLLGAAYAAGALGAASLAWRLAGRGTAPGNLGARIGFMGAGVAVATLLAQVPVAGPLVDLLVVIFGLGGFARAWQAGRRMTAAPADG